MIWYNKKLKGGSRHNGSPAGPFLKSPPNKRTRIAAIIIYIQDRGFSSFAENVIKLSVTKTKWTSLARTSALSFPS